MSPESVGEKAFIRAVLPIGFDVYWYFSAYFCVFFFAPFFNKILEVCDEKQLTVFVIISVTFFSIFPVVFNNDIFITNNGFSALWLSVLYIIGGYIRKYEIYKKIRNSKCMLLYFAGVFVTFGHKVITEFLRLKINGEVVDERLLIQYTSPTILLCAVALLCFFAKVNLKESLKRFTSVFSPLAFSVYLIHTAPFVWTRVMKNRFVCLTALNPFFMVLAVFGFAVGIFLLCSLVDFVRMSLFKMLKVNKLSVEIEKLITKSIDKIVKTMHLAGDSD